MPAKRKQSRKSNKVPPIQCQWGMLCSISSVDQERNNISLFNVIDQFQIPKEVFTKQTEIKDSNGVQAIYHPLELVICWRRTLDLSVSKEEFSFDFKIKTIDPNGEVIQEILAQNQIPYGAKILRFRAMMNGIVVTGFGNYCFQIELKSQDKDEFTKTLEVPFIVTEHQEKKV